MFVAHDFVFGQLSVKAEADKALKRRKCPTLTEGRALYWERGGPKSAYKASYWEKGGAKSVYRALYSPKGVTIGGFGTPIVAMLGLPAEISGDDRHVAPSGNRALTRPAPGEMPLVGLATPMLARETNPVPSC